MILEQYVGPSHKFTTSAPSSFDLAGLAGMVTEFSGWNQSACISLATPLIRECQAADKLCAWIVPEGTEGASLFFPPDFRDAGIDCAELPIIWSEDAMDSFGIAEKLLRSGGFGMLVLDLSRNSRLRGQSLGRIHAVAQRSGSLVLCFTRKPRGRASLDPLVFFHLHVAVEKKGADTWEVFAHVLKDKRAVTGRSLRWVYEAPLGLC